MEAIRAVYAEWGRGNWRPRFDVYDAEMEWGWSDDFSGWPASITTPPTGTSGSTSG